jgi:hypothetical protein
MGSHLCIFAVGIVSLLVAMIGGQEAVGYSGFVYFAIGPILMLYYSWMGRRARAAGLLET